MPGEIIKTAASINKRQWRRGLLGAAISGGAAAFASGSAVTMADSHDFNLESWHAAFRLAVVVVLTFGGAAFTSVMKYLHEHPLPDEAPEAT